MHYWRTATQLVQHLDGEQVRRLVLPPAGSSVVPGLLWGRHDELCTPAYWAAQSWMWELDEPEHYRLGRTLREELLACMLGGYGIPAEVGLAAYDRLRPQAAGSGQALCDEAQVRAQLAAPLSVGKCQVRYRFVNQKSRHVSAAFRALGADAETLPDRCLRDHLTGLPGVGPKTASWVVRNLRGSDEVAILDVHLMRAGRMLGVFDASLEVGRHYARLEGCFLRFAAAIGSRASILDSVIWMTMRRLPRALLNGMMTEMPVRSAGAKRTEVAVGLRH